MKFVTVDTGYKGAMVLFDGDTPLDAFKFHKVGTGINLHEMDVVLDMWLPDRIYIEVFPPQPYQGVTTTAHQWKVVGEIGAVCQLNCSLVEHIYVATWTSFTKKLSSNPDLPNKKISQELATKYYPTFASKYRKRKLIHDGIADCVCMGIFVNRDLFLDDII